MIENCPCGSAHNYPDCCGAYINETKLPATPEALMRSRYTAYTSQQIDYIEKTMCGKAAQGFNKQEAYAWSKAVTWLGLKVIKASVAGEQGWVEFIAGYKVDNQNQQIHETSEFSLIDGRWYYTDGNYRK